MSDLLYEVNDHICVVTLNRPDAMNSLTYQLYADLEDTVRSSEARALVITGNGRAFCAGAVSYTHLTLPTSDLV